MAGSNPAVEVFSEFPEEFLSGWNKLAGDSVFFNPVFLRCLEHMRDESFSVRYMVAHKSGNVMMIGVFHVTGFKAPDLETNVRGKSGFMRAMATSLVRKDALRKARILISGSAFATGEHGFRYAKELDASMAAACLNEAIRLIMLQESEANARISAVLIKDFFPESRRFAEILSGTGYTSFTVDHNMVMPVLPEWKTFDDYLASMNTKFRTKAKGVMKKSGNLRVTAATAKDILDNLPRMKLLFDEVVSNAAFSLGKMNLDILPEMKERLGAGFRCLFLYRDDTLVGFLTSLKCGPHMEAFVVGIDYSCNRELAVYNRMLLEYVKIAIEERCQTIFFSRTASEIKSTVGALPVEMICLIRHPSGMKNALLRVLFSYVKASSFEQRYPYLQATEERISRQMESFLQSFHKE
jgi:hypothetical protein